MGVYIQITNQFSCPVCKQQLHKWQSKDLNYDGYPIENLLQQLQINKKIDGEVHTNCDVCGFVQYKINKGKLC